MPAGAGSRVCLTVLRGPLRLLPRLLRRQGLLQREGAADEAQQGEQAGRLSLLACTKPLPPHMAAIEGSSRRVLSAGLLCFCRAGDDPPAQVAGAARPAPQDPTEGQGRGAPHTTPSPSSVLAVSATVGLSLTWPYAGAGQSAQAAARRHGRPQGATLRLTADQHDCRSLAGARLYLRVARKVMADRGGSRDCLLAVVGCMCRPRCCSWT